MNAPFRPETDPAAVNAERCHLIEARAVLDQGMVALRIATREGRWLRVLLDMEDVAALARDMSLALDLLQTRVTEEPAP